MSILIDAHGSDHGLRVEIDGSDVKIWEWRELCDPDESGSFQPAIQSASMTLRECLKHAGEAHRSQRDRVIAGATQYVAQHGYDEIKHVSDDDRPCDHFGRYWGSKHVPAHLSEPDYREQLTCQHCDVAPSFDAGDALAYAP